MKISIKTQEFEIKKVPFENTTDIIIYDYEDDLEKYKINVFKKLSDKILELEIYIETLEKHI